MSASYSLQKDFPEIFCTATYGTHEPAFFLCRLAYAESLYSRRRSPRVVPLLPQTFHLLKHVFILGTRAPACLEWARAFSRASWRVTVADPLHWHLARPSDFAHLFLRLPEPRRDPRGWVKALFKAIRSAKIDEVLPTCEEVFSLAHG